MCLCVVKLHQRRIKHINMIKERWLQFTPCLPFVEHYKRIRLSIHQYWDKWSGRGSCPSNKSSLGKNWGPNSRIREGYGIKAGNIVPDCLWEGEVYQRDTDKLEWVCLLRVSSSPVQIQSPVDKVPPPEAWCHNPSGQASFWESWWQVRSVH